VTLKDTLKIGETKHRTFLFIASTLLIYPISKIIFKTNKGLDFTDEGIFLLAASVKDKSESLLFPWGWHTSIIYQLANENVSNFRALGATISFGTSYILGLQTYLFLVKTLSSVKRNSNLTETIFSISVGISSWFLYSGFHRTPNYNWLNSVGLTIALTGFMLVMQIEQERIKTFKAEIGKGTIALGLFITIPAKPSTAIIAIVVIIPSIARKFRKDYKKISYHLFMYLLILLFLSLIFKVWPHDFIENFKFGLNTPHLNENQTFSGIGKDLVNTPAKILSSMKYLIAYILIIVLIYLNKKFKKIEGCTFIFIYMLFAIFEATEIIKTLFGSKDSLYIYLPLASIFLVFCAMGFATSIDRRNFHVWYPFLVFPFIPGIGSTHGIFGMASLNLNFLFLFLLAMALINHEKLLQFIMCLVSILLAAILLAGVIFNGTTAPFRLSPMREQTIPVSFLNNENQLKVDFQTAGKILRLKKGLSEVGWVLNTPMITLLWGKNHSATIPYFLGADVPKSLEISIPGYGINSFLFAKHNIENKLDKQFAQNAWLMLSCETDIGSEKYIYGEIIDLLEKQGKIQFPENYTMVYNYDCIEVWKPAND
jgi:hypothetical protein